MNCRVKGCGVVLIVGENWYPSQEKHHNFICTSCFREVKMRLRRTHGIKELIPAEKGKYGVPMKLPNGKMNPEYDKRRYAAKRLAQGKAPRPSNWGNMYGVPYKLPNGKTNPEYMEHWRRAHGIKPQPSKYGVPYRLPNGKSNPEYHRRQYNATQKRQRKPSKYGVRCKLPNGKNNPEYTTALSRAKGYKPRKAIGDNKCGVPSRINGKKNPEYARRQRQLPESRNSKAKLDARRRRLPPLEIIIGHWFEGANLHHMTKTIGIWIPASLHKSIYHNIWTGKNMDKMNAAALDWFVSNSFVQ